jgi:hypothetical protein
MKVNIRASRKSWWQKAMLCMCAAEHSRTLQHFAAGVSSGGQLKRHGEAATKSETCTCMCFNYDSRPCCVCCCVPPSAATAVVPPGKS